LLVDHIELPDIDYDMVDGLSKTHAGEWPQVKPLEGERTMF